MKCPKCQTDNPGDSKFCKECATPLPSSEKPQISVTRTLETTPFELARGTIFAGRYEILEELGAGGMGAVYRVYDRKLEEEVALKLIRPEIAANRRAIERFKNELKVARKITHKSVCKMYDLGEAEGASFITMEYVPGEDLKSFIRRVGQLPAGKAVAIAKQVCLGLAEAHGLGVVHRDLKPGNIMIDKDGNAKIMDFGIARSLLGKGLTGEGAIIGTPEYMSPEQVEGKEADQRSDIYSLGIILYQMVTGRVPFEGDTPLSVALKQKTEAPRSPRTINPQIPEDLSRTILRCLEKEKEQRYQTVEEVLADLEKTEKGIPTAERIITKKERLTSREITVKFRLKKLFVPALAFFVLIAAGIILWHVLPAKKPALPPSTSGMPTLAVLYFENISGDPSLDVWQTGLTELLITDLYQSKLIRVLDGNRTYSILKKFNLEEATKYTREDLVKVANEGGATYTASGSLMKAGESIVIMLTLQKPHSGEVIDSVRLTCQNEAEILPKTDELAAKIKSDMNLSSAQIAVDAGPGIDKITTNSPEALKYYLESFRYLRMLDFDKVVALLEKAIGLDPQFALAYISLAAGYESLGNHPKGRELRNKAYDLKDRLPARERYLVEANYYIGQSEKTTDKLMEVYEKYFELAPDDVDERESLGLVYAHRFEDYEKSLEQMEMAYRIAPSPQLLDSLARAYERMGFYDKAEKAFQDYLDTHEDNYWVHYWYSFLYLVQRKYELAFAEMEKVYLLEPSKSWIEDQGWLHLLKGDLAEAEKLFLQVYQKEDRASRNLGRILLNCLDLHMGRFGRAAADLEKAMQPGGDTDEGFQEGGVWFVVPYTPYIFLRSNQIERALEVINRRLQWSKETDSPAEQRIALWWKGLVNIDAKRVAEAERIAGELRGLCEQSVSRKAIRYYDHLQGLIDLEKGDYPAAVENFKKAFSMLPFESADFSRGQHALFLYPLGLAYYRAGDLEKAESEYEKITRLTAGRVAYGDLYAKSFYMLGKIAEAQGDRRRAAENYRQFLELWKDADLGLPEVEDARKRLAAL